MQTNKTTKTVTKTIETVTTITTVEVITEIQVITIEEPIETAQEQPKVQDQVVLTPKVKSNPAEVGRTEPKMTDPKYLTYLTKDSEVESNQVPTAVLHTLLYWDTETKHRKVKEDFIGRQLEYMPVGRMTYSKLWIDKDKFTPVLYHTKGNYQLKPEFKARLEQYIQDNSIESVDAYGNVGIKLKPYSKVSDQDYEFFKSVGHIRIVK